MRSLRGAFRSFLKASPLLIASMLFAQAGTQNGTLATIPPEASQIVGMINHARVASGIRPLQWDATLAEAARQHGLRMAAEGSAEHQYTGEPALSERAGQSGAHFSLIGEEVAVASTPAVIHEEWMTSRDSRANLLDPQMDRVGIAVIASDGDLYAVADFDRAVIALTQAQVESTIGGLLRRSGITVLHDATAARAVCVTDRPLPSADAGRHPGFVLRWQDPDMTHLPPVLAKLIHTPRYSEAEVGSCPAQGVEGSFTAYRVAVLLY